MKVVSIEDAVQAIFAHFAQARSRTIRLATPLGLGKPNPLINAFYKRVAQDSSYALEIFTALSLDPPDPKPGLEARFAKPFLERHFGRDYPRLAYLDDLRGGAVPPNIRIEEFYIEAGRYKDIPYAQQTYVSLNYTHVVSSLAEKGVNLVFQMIAKRGERYSLSCNTDLTLDLRDRLAADGRSFYFVGVVHPDLPFVGGDAVLDEAAFDLLVESPEIAHQLFALPRSSIDEVDHGIGLHASQLVVDDGSLQIGIGSLSDALVNALILRQRNNADYRQLLGGLSEGRLRSGWEASFDVFEKGLYGTSEMVMDGFMHLRRAGILRRTVRDSQRDVYVHGAFFLGSKVFYDWLRDLSDEDFNGFSMTRVSKVNDLYDPDELTLRRQRKNARFFNTCMNVTLLGGAASDTLSDGRVISGVGGQYNFVAMAHELPDARSILMLRSSSLRHGKRYSNIVWSHGQLTIPRHLRDIVVTEYGIASLRGKSDREVILELLAIADVEFQDELLATARKHGKVTSRDRIPDYARRNNAKELSRRLQPFKAQLSAYPFGSDFTPLELKLLKALNRLKNMSTLARLKTAFRGLRVPQGLYAEEMERMDFAKTNSLRPRFERKILLGVLNKQSE